jgi:hypothetical protein
MNCLIENEYIKVKNGKKNGKNNGKKKTEKKTNGKTRYGKKKGKKSVGVLYYGGLLFFPGSWRILLRVVY